MDTDCIEWTKGCTTAGYGEVFVNGRVVYAHRVAFEDAHGPIPAGMTVHHLCHNRRCTNVQHMELLSRRDHAGGLGHGKLTEEQAYEVRELALGGRSHRSLSRDYGISIALVSLIRNGKRWANV